MKYAKLVLIICLLALLSACACAHPRKAPIPVRRSSYILLAPNIAQVSYSEERPTKRIDLETDLVYACATATVDYGYDYFIILGGDLAPSAPTYASARFREEDTYYTRPTWGNSKYYYKVTEVTYDEPGDKIHDGQRQATVLIQMFKKPHPPKMWYAIDARELIFYKKPPG